LTPIPPPSPLSDAFADAEAANDGPAPAAAATTGSGKTGNGLVHIRVQQRNGRKSLTTIQGLDKGIDHKKVIKAFKKEFCCNGTVVEDADAGAVIQLQGDQRKSASQFLLDNKLVKKAALKIHGF
jgi:translation initiation factor 1